MTHFRMALFALLCFTGFTGLAEEIPPGTPSLADELCRGFETIQTLSGRIRKMTQAGGKTVRLLSRVHYSNDLRIHVHNVSPAQRRILSDGVTLYYHEDGRAKGYSSPVNELDEDWAASLRNIPGSPYEHLVNLRNLPETHLPPTETAPLRRGYETERHWVVLEADEPFRVLRIAFYDLQNRNLLQGEYLYSEFLQAGPQCWIPQRHQGFMRLPDGTRIEETRIVESLELNQPIPDHLFNPALFFENVKFVPDFLETLR